GKGAVEQLANHHDGGPRRIVGRSRERLRAWRRRDVVRVWLCHRKVIAVRSSPFGGFVRPSARCGYQPPANCELRIALPTLCSFGAEVIAPAPPTSQTPRDSHRDQRRGTVAQARRHRDTWTPRDARTDAAPCRT